MAYRNGTYVAFNGMGTTNPTEGDMKYYGLLQVWGKEKSIDFKFSDSHKKTYSVRDSSLERTLKNRLSERMSHSKNMVLIITENSSINRGLLNWEIEKAIDHFKIPIILAYTGYKSILRPGSLSDLWPQAFKDRIDSVEVKAIHIPFKKKPIGEAISQFSIHNQMPKSSLSYYSKEVYERWGLN